MIPPQQLVFIVDDSADYRLLVSQVFKRYLTQYKTRFFTSGTALLEHLQTEAPERPFLVLIDGHMPEMSGLETLALLKQNVHWQKVPIVIVSSGSSTNDQQQAYASGADSYLVKPTDMASLTEQIGLLCQRWSAFGNSPAGAA
jgi:CheY-like chemotaxis protein